MFDIITFGSATQDIIVKPKNLTTLKYDPPSRKASDGQGKSVGSNVCFPVGSKVEVEDMQFYSGGGGTNTAATFSAQGFKTAFCGMVGGDVSGQEIINELKRLKINTSLVQKTTQKRTNHSVIILNSGTDRTILAYRGAAELMKDIPLRKLSAKWLYLAPLSGELCNNFANLVNFAVSKKIKIAVNPSMAQLALPNFSEIAKKIDVLIMNQEEASFLTKIPFDQEKEIFKKLDEICPRIAVMTRGGEGVVVSDGKVIYSAVPPVNRNIVDTTGAGDAFGSGFISEYMRSANIESAIQFGMADSVGCLSEVGAKNGLLKKGQEFEKVEVKEETL